MPCHHGGYYTCADRYNPGHLLAHKWENCFTVCCRLVLILLYLRLFNRSTDIHGDICVHLVPMTI